MGSIPTGGSILIAKRFARIMGQSSPQALSPNWSIMRTRPIALTCAVIATLGILSACSTDDQSRIQEVSQIRYTGETQTDLRSLCKIGSLVNGMNNTSRAVVQNVVLTATEQFADTSDPKVATLVENLRLLTSADQEMRAKGEQVVDSTCASI